MAEIVHIRDDGTVVAIDGGRVLVGTPRRIGWHELDRVCVNDDDGWQVTWVAPHDPNQVFAAGRYESDAFDPDDGWDSRPQIRAWIDGDGVQQTGVRQVTVYDFREVN